VAALIAIPRLIAYKPKPAPNSNASRTRDNAPAPLAVPQEDFFYPEEPDFLPKVLLDREPRRNWTPQDASPFWKEPAGEDPQEWRGHIETVINELLEGVP
jgi:hypothetical protein